MEENKITPETEQKQDSPVAEPEQTTAIESEEVGDRKEEGTEVVSADSTTAPKEEKKKKSLFKKIVDVFSTVILVIALLILGFAVYSRISGGNPSFFGYNFYLVLTDSMTPEIQPNDLVIAKQVDKSQLKVGDDIVFVSKNPDSLGVKLVHRIIRIEGETITTRGIKLNGDGTPLPEDQPITEVLGRVEFHSTFLGLLPAAFTRHPQIAFGILIGVMVLLVIMLFIDVIKAFMLPADGVDPNEKPKTETQPQISDSERDAIEARAEAKEEVNRVFYDCDDPISPEEIEKGEQAKKDENDENNA
ncbi:MAG: signal peptidase I [Clostridia bacterium]|nr:signal peptidase I [Clostridia bacterium]